MCAGVVLWGLLMLRWVVKDLCLPLSKVPASNATSWQLVTSKLGRQASQQCWHVGDWYNHAVPHLYCMPKPGLVHTYIVRQVLVWALLFAAL